MGGKPLKVCTERPSSANILAHATTREQLVVFWSVWGFYLLSFLCLILELTDRDKYITFLVFWYRWPKVKLSAWSVSNIEVVLVLIHLNNKTWQLKYSSLRIVYRNQPGKYPHFYIQHPYILNYYSGFHFHNNTYNT